jgi:hypothetical protein
LNGIWFRLLHGRHCVLVHGCHKTKTIESSFKLLCLQQIVSRILERTHFEMPARWQHNWKVTISAWSIWVGTCWWQSVSAQWQF